MMTASIYQSITARLADIITDGHERVNSLKRYGRIAKKMGFPIASATSYKSAQAATKEIAKLVAIQKVLKKQR